MAVGDVVIAAGVLVGLIGAAWVVVLCHTRLRRLHRLHIRVDAARAGLDAALARRMAVAARAGVSVSAPASASPHRRPDAGAGTATPVAPDPAGPTRFWAPIATPLPKDSAAPTRRRGSTATPPPTDSAARTRRRGCTAIPPPTDSEAVANALSRALARLDRDSLPPDVWADLADAEQLLVIARRVHNDAVRDTLGLRSRRLVRWLRLAGTAPMPAYFEIADPPPALTYDRVSPSQE